MAFPGFPYHGVFGIPCLAEGLKCVHRLLLICAAVDLLQVPAESLEVLVAYELCAVPHHMDDAQLDFCLGEDRPYGFRKARKPIHARKKDIPDAT